MTVATIENRSVMDASVTVFAAYMDLICDIASGPIKDSSRMDRQKLYAAADMVLLYNEIILDGAHEAGITEPGKTAYEREEIVALADKLSGLPDTEMSEQMFSRYRAAMVSDKSD